MRVHGSWVRTSFIITIAVFIVFAGSIFLTVHTLADGRIVQIRSGSMINGESASISDGDLVKMRSVGSLDSVRTYVRGVDEGYRKAGSYGDVIFFKPNGDQEAILIVHRAVVCVYFNSSTYDPTSKTGGGFDVPSLDIYNLDGKMTIEDYEWPKNPTSHTLVIDLELILKGFRNKGERPHSGFITKGDSNWKVDQTAVYTDDGELLEPVEVDWIKGKFDDKLDTGPAVISIGVSSLLLPVMTAVTIFLFRSKKAAEKKETNYTQDTIENERSQLESEDRLTAVELDGWVGD